MPAYSFDQKSGPVKTNDRLQAFLRHVLRLLGDIDSIYRCTFSNLDCGGSP